MVKNFQIEKRYELYLDCFMFYSWYILEIELIITNSELDVKNEGKWGNWRLL